MGALPLAGCFNPSANLPTGEAAYRLMPPEDAERGPESYRIGILDTLSVRVFQEPELSFETLQVDASGTINFPFVGAVPVAGLTPGKAATEIQTRLADGYLNDPIVSVFVKEFNSRQVFVLGEVKNPGPYPFSDGMTIVEAIALAGGATDDGLPNRTSVARIVDGQEVNITVRVNSIKSGEEPNFTLLPDDIVNVPESPI